LVQPLFHSHLQSRTRLRAAGEMTGAGLLKQS
jgi:hypothetical protein